MHFKIPKLAENTLVLNVINYLFQIIYYKLSHQWSKTNGPHFFKYGCEIQSRICWIKEPHKLPIGISHEKVPTLFEKLFCCKCFSIDPEDDPTTDYEQMLAKTYELETEIEKLIIVYESNPEKKKLLQEILEQ